MGIADLLARFDVASKEEDQEQLHRLRTMIIRSVHLVSRGANRRDFAVRKGEEPPMLTNDIIGLEITKTSDGTVTVGKANRDKVAADLEALAKKLSDPDADEKELAMAAKSVVDMLSSAEKAGKKQMPGEEEDGGGGAGGPPNPEEEEEKAKAKKAKEDKEEAAAKAKEEEEKKAKEAAKKDEGSQVTEAFAVLAKAAADEGTRLAVFKSALELLQKVGDGMGPQEAAANEGLMAVAKALTGLKAPEQVPAGNAATSVAKADDRKPKESGWTFGVNINNPDLHRETADPSTSFFEKK